MASKMIKLDVEVNCFPVYVTATGLRQGSKGLVDPVGDVYGSTGKGEARKVRKALRRIGRRDLSGAPRYT